MTKDDDVRGLRAGAHPVRLRILSLLTGSAMSAAEIARELDLTHANASYHLQVLARAGEVVEAGGRRSGAASPSATGTRGPSRSAARGTSGCTCARWARSWSGATTSATTPSPGRALLLRRRALGRRGDLGAGARPRGGGRPPGPRRRPPAARRGHPPRQPLDRRLRDAAVSRAAALAPLREPNFRWYFLSRVVNLCGTTMAPVALAFAVLEISDSPATSASSWRPTASRWSPSCWRAA